MIDFDKMMVAKGLTKQQVDLIKAEVRREFPDDEMMYELHLIRLMDSFIRGDCSIEDLLEIEPGPIHNQVF